MKGSFRILLAFVAVWAGLRARAQVPGPFLGTPADPAAALPVGRPLPADAPLLASSPARRRAARTALAAPDLVYVPAATFTMGNPYSHLNEGFSSELPVHSVTVSSFLMARTEVTTTLAASLLQYACDRGLAAVKLSTNGLPHSVVSLEGTNRPTLMYLQGLTNVVHVAFDPGGGTFEVLSGKEDFPAFYVTWYGALAMANYLSDALGLPRAVDPDNGWSVDLAAPGFRIPTEAEWERAARGDLSTYPTHFPWPNDSVYGDKSYVYSVDPWKANYTDYRFVSSTYGLVFHPRHPWFDEPVRTTPVAWYDGNQIVTNNGYVPSSFVGADYGQTNDMANSIGLYDMAGNVAEWCIDYYYEAYTTNYYPGYASNPVTNPCVSFPASSDERFLDYHVFRGGAWFHRYEYWDYYDPSVMRCSYRDWAYPPDYAEAINGFRLVRPLSPYETWAAAHFPSPLSTEAAPSADPDADHFPNASEFAACTDPTNSASRLAVTALDTSSISLTFPAVSGLVYSVEAAAPSADPNWNRILTVTAPATAPMTLPIPATNGAFLRLTLP